MLTHLPLSINKPASLEASNTFAVIINDFIITNQLDTYIDKLKAIPTLVYQCMSLCSLQMPFGWTINRTIQSPISLFQPALADQLPERIRLIIVDSQSLPLLKCPEVNDRDSATPLDTGQKRLISIGFRCTLVPSRSP